LFNSDEKWAIIIRSRVFRDRKHVAHHISSSIWSSVKNEYSAILDNSTFLIGNGEDIYFWTDRWCGPPLCDIFHLPAHIHNSLTSRVSDYMIEDQWIIPWQLQLQYPSLRQIVEKIVIPFEPKPDKLMWHNTKSGDLSLKEAYQLKDSHANKLHWASTIWSIDIPPSRSLVAWRIMHDKMPTDEKLKERGCSFPSICNLYLNQEETTFHVFFDCSYAMRLWNWLASTLNFNLHFNNIEEIWQVCDRRWNPQCKVVIKAAMVNVLSTIWFARNSARFKNKSIHWKSAISSISSNVTFSGNNTKASSNSSMTDFAIIKKFRVNVHPPRAPQIKEVMWHPPIRHWIKSNTDGSSSSETSASGIIFRDSNADCLLCISKNLGMISAFHVELLGAMRAIEIAFQRNWLNFWLESDSMLVVNAFSNSNIVPWHLSNRWLNCMKLLTSMNFVISHIFREGNQCVDSLANFGLTIQGLFSWESAPSFISSFLVQNKLGMPNYRFVSF